MFKFIHFPHQRLSHPLPPICIKVYFYLISFRMKLKAFFCYLAHAGISLRKCKCSLFSYDTQKRFSDLWLQFSAFHCGGAVISNVPLKWLNICKRRKHIKWNFIIYRGVKHRHKQAQAHG